MHFWKYQGAGNDFILVDQRRQQWITRADTERVAFLCDRHFGIGADGLILLQTHPDFDFEMIYFNADGRESTMCGNGGRCIVAFAHQIGIEQERYRFLAIDGPHDAVRTTQPGQPIWIELQMRDVHQIETLLPSPAHSLTPSPAHSLYPSPAHPLPSSPAHSLTPSPAHLLNTGSPHYVRFVPALDDLDLVPEGRAVRYSERFREAGVNVNFVQEMPEGLCIRTYERGVEDETLACGTGVTAAALAQHARQGWAPGQYEVAVKARGGDLSVRFLALPDGGYTDVWLCGPAVAVFSGEI